MRFKMAILEELRKPVPDRIAKLNQHGSSYNCAYGNHTLPELEALLVLTVKHFHSLKVLLVLEQARNRGLYVIQLTTLSNLLLSYVSDCLAEVPHCLLHTLAQVLNLVRNHFKPELFGCCVRREIGGAVF